MKGIDLLEAIGQIDESYIEELSRQKQRKAYYNIRRQLVPLAACILMLGIASFVWTTTRPMEGNMTEGAGGAEEAAEEMEINTMDQAVESIAPMMEAETSNMSQAEDSTPRMALDEGDAGVQEGLLKESIDSDTLVLRYQGNTYQIIADSMNAPVEISESGTYLSMPSNFVGIKDSKDIDFQELGVYYRNESENQIAVLVTEGIWKDYFLIFEYIDEENLNE